MTDGYWSIACTGLDMWWFSTQLEAIRIRGVRAIKKAAGFQGEECRKLPFTVEGETIPRPY
jgi:hypothetical protein